MTIIIFLILSLFYQAFIQSYYPFINYQFNYTNNQLVVHFNVSKYPILAHYSQPLVFNSLKLAKYFVILHLQVLFYYFQNL